jgi:methylenetetrahydrofolate reductase (NADPH)
MAEEEIKTDVETVYDSKIADLMGNKIENELPFMSIEFFPPKTEVGVNKLYDVLEKLKVLNPLFADITWGAGGSTSELTLTIVDEIKKRGLIPNMHLTCTNMDHDKVDNAIKDCINLGVMNILALRGDPPKGETVWHSTDVGLGCGLDLVTYIRETYATYSNKLNITVAGYPEGHPAAMVEVPDGFDSLTETEKNRCSFELNKETGETVVYVCKDEAYTKELTYLKQKVDAGANMIITQMFFDVPLYHTFVQDCRNIGITIPILPGIMCLGTYEGFNRMIGFCKTRVPQAMRAILDKAHEAKDTTEEAIKEAAAHFKQVGLDIIKQMCTDLLALGRDSTPGLHFYTLNQAETTISICTDLRNEKLIR